MFLRRTLSTSLPVIEALGIVGGGQMGTGIALDAVLKAGIPVTVVDPNPSALVTCESSIARYLKKHDCTEHERSFQLTRDLTRLSHVDFIIEAVTEKTETKLSIFRDLDQIAPPRAVFATNTSSISITSLAQARPERTIGMHFFSPVPQMPVIELIAGLQTTKETIDMTRNLAQAMGKQVIVCKNHPGFIANRLLMPYLNEAAIAFDEGLASREDIDDIMKLGTKVPMGPLELADFIGLDTCLSIMKTLQEGLGNAKYHPAPIFVEYVEAGFLGKKTNRGFYHYDEQGRILRSS